MIYLSIAELLTEEVRLYKKKNDAYSKYLSSKDKIKEIADEMHSTWEDYQKKKENFDKLYGPSMDPKTIEDRIWADYLSEASKNKTRIKNLAKKRRVENGSFRKFNKIGADHMKSGHRKKALAFFEQANEHLAKSRQYEAEIKELHNKNYQLRIEAERQSEYKKLKDEMRSAKKRHFSIKEQLKCAREERDIRKRYYHRSKMEFDDIQRKIQEWQKCHT